jgi:hypothetical protein
LQVQVAIDHNKKVFEARMRMEDCATLRKAFSSWRAARYGSVAKQQILVRAMARLQVIAVLLISGVLAWVQRNSGIWL